MTEKEFYQLLQEQYRIISRAVPKPAVSPMPELSALIQQFPSKVHYCMGIYEDPSAKIEDLASTTESSIRIVEGSLKAFLDTNVDSGELKATHWAGLLNDYYDVADQIVRITVDVHISRLPSSVKSKEQTSNCHRIAKEIEDSASRGKRIAAEVLLLDSRLQIRPRSTRYPRTWNAVLEGENYSVDAVLNSRYYFFLAVLCHERIHSIDPIIKRGFPLEKSAIEAMPKKIKEKLSQDESFAWVGDSRVVGPNVSLATDQSKMKSAVNKKIGAELIVYDEPYYLLYPVLKSDNIDLPDTT